LSGIHRCHDLSSNPHHALISRRADGFSLSDLSHRPEVWLWLCCAVLWGLQRATYSGHKCCWFGGTLYALMTAFSVNWITSEKSIFMADWWVRNPLSVYHISQIFMARRQIFQRSISRNWLAPVTIAFG